MEFLLAPTDDLIRAAQSRWQRQPRRHWGVAVHLFYICISTTKLWQLVSVCADCKKYVLHANLE